MVASPIPRRVFLSSGAVFGATLPWFGLSSAGVASPADLVPRRAFFDDADYASVRISPDGRHLAYLAPLDGVRNLWVAPRTEPGAARPITRVTDRNLGTSIRWAYTSRHLVFFQEHDGDENWRASSVDIETGAIVPLTPQRGVRSFLQELDGKFPGQVLIRHNQRDPRMFDLFRIDVVTGASEMLFENRDYVLLITDSDFQLRLGARFAADGSAEYFERSSDGTWAPFTTVPIGDVDASGMIDFSANGKTLYMLDSRGRDKAVLVAIDMASRQAGVLAADDEADIVEVLFSDDRRPLAARAMTDRSRWQALDPGTERDLASLAEHNPGDIYFISGSADDRTATVYFERDMASGEYALFDRQTLSVRTLYRQRKTLDQLALHRLEAVAIVARDGLRLNGYLTRPEPATTGMLPMVLAIHGGPYARDQWGFNPIHQWLASRGYAVLSINYRGSTGFGKAFVTAADREWGGRMQDDLIDALDWAIAQGIADPKRVGLFGASYGGYAALTAATRTPERFACIVDAFGISNLLTFMATIPPYWGPWFSIWKNRLGDPDSDAGRALLAERSPLTHIERAVRPILIAQGMQDVRVVAAESEQMVAALKRHGVPVTYVSFSDEGHGFARPANRLAFYAVAEAFLAKHLGGRYQPIEQDLAGSTLRVETGGDLVPGMKGE